MNWTRLLIFLMGAIGLFVLDLISPLGIASGILYVALVLASLWFRGRRQIITTVVVSSILICIGWYFSEPSDNDVFVLLNRLYSILAIWLVAIVLYQQRLNQTIRLKEISEGAFQRSYYILVAAFTVFLSGGLVLVIYNYNEQRDQVIDELVKSQEYRINSAKQEAIATLHQLYSDMLQLGVTDQIGIPPDPMLRERLVDKFITLAEITKRYDQVRLLDSTGMEIIRVNYQNGQASEIPVQELQNKSHRYYFQESIKLIQGQIYISPVDLNMEDGIIEIPEKPMLRLGMPVFDENQVRTGVLIINYLAENLLQSQKPVQTMLPMKLQLLNREGYWLHGEDSTSLFGFMYPDRRDRTFANSFEKEWSYMKNMKNGEMETENGYFIFRSMSLEEVYHDRFGFNNYTLSDHSTDIIYLIHVPVSVLASVSNEVKQEMVLTGSSIILIFMTIIWFFAKRYTEVRRVRDKLYEASDFQQLMLDTIPNAVIFTDEEIRIQWINKSAETLFGYNQSELQGKTSDILHAEPHKQEELTRQKETGFREHFETEIKVRKKDGSIVITKTNIREVKDLNDELKGYLVIARDITKERETEHELEVFERYFDVSQDVICMIDFHGNFLNVNPVFTEVLGYSEKEILGKKFTRFAQKDDQDTFRVSLEKLKKGSRTGKFTIKFRDKSGNFHDLEWVASSDVENGLIYASARDITENLKVWDALKLSQFHLDKFIREAPVSVAMLDNRMNYLAASQIWIDNITSDVPYKTGLNHYTHAPYVFENPDFKAAHIKGLRGEMVAYDNYKITNQDGSVRWSNWKVIPWYQEGRTVGGIIIYSEDVTSKIKFENKLKSLNEELEKSVKQRTAELEEASNELEQQLNLLNSSASISITDPEGTITQVNDQFCIRSGYKRREIIGRSHNITSSGYHGADFFEKMWDTIRKGKIWKGDIKNKSKNGKYYWDYTVISPFLDADGNIEKFVCVRFDITRRIEFEEELQQSRQAIEDQANELHQINAKLKQQTNQLETANKELESFSYSVSHDLRAPLRALEGFSKLLLKEYSDKLDERGKKWVNFINTNTHKMDQLIQDILSFSRISRAEFRKREVNMDLLVDEVVSELSPIYKDHKLEIRKGKISPVNGDHAALKQVWSNLISNALKYSTQEKIIKVEIESRKKGNRVTYSVRDNGAGFDEKYENKLYSIFQRLHTEDEFEGTGVGLAIVKKIIDKHGGQITAESKPGEGARFSFTLPINGDKHEKPQS